MWIRLRIVIKRSPFLYPIAKRLVDERAERRLCTRTTDLYIEGYPSSGNSFSFVLLSSVRADLWFAHHSHSVANLRIALKHGIPAIALVRAPEEAIASRVVRFRREVEVCVLEYVDFYSYVLREFGRLIVISFERLTADTEWFLQTVEQRTGLAFPCEDPEALIRRTRKSMMEGSRARGRAERVGLPRPEREARKLKVVEELRRSELFGEAKAVWREVMQRLEDIDPGRVTS